MLTEVMHFQESIKTKHPQLLYESKLYKILQGGGKQFVPDAVMTLYASISVQCLGCSWHT